MTVKLIANQTLIPRFFCCAHEGQETAYLMDLKPEESLVSFLAAPELPSEVDRFKGSVRALFVSGIIRVIRCALIIDMGNAVKSTGH